MHDLLAESAAFIDRFGVYWGPWTLAIRLAQLMARRFREPVLAAVAEDERDLRARAVTGSYAYQPRVLVGHETPPEFYVGILAERLPTFGLVREWCGADEQER